MSFGKSEHSEIHFIIGRTTKEVTDLTNAFLKENKGKGWTIVNYVMHAYHNEDGAGSIKHVILAR